MAELGYRGVRDKDSSAIFESNERQNQVHRIWALNRLALSDRRMDLKEMIVRLLARCFTVSM